MKTFKNVLVVILAIVIFSGCIGLLMAFDDGLLNGTLINDVIRVVLPSLIGSCAILLIASNLPKGISDTIHYGWLFLISFVLLILCIIFLDKNILETIGAVILISVAIELVILFLKNIINKFK